jgi:hypothetical protein
MKERGGSLLQAAGLTLWPVVLLFPVLALAGFGPTGVRSVWPIVLYAPIAMWMETRAIRLLLNMFRDGRDPFLLAILPLGVIALCVYALNGFVFILGLPGLVKYFV